MVMFPGISFWWKFGVISKGVLDNHNTDDNYICNILSWPGMCLQEVFFGGGLVVLDQVSNQTQVIHPYLGKQGDG